jgi:hypothetical protein
MAVGSTPKSSLIPSSIAGRRAASAVPDLSKVRGQGLPHATHAILLAGHPTRHAVRILASCHLNFEANQNKVLVPEDARVPASLANELRGGPKLPPGGYSKRRTCCAIPAVYLRNCDIGTPQETPPG